GRFPPPAQVFSLRPKQLRQTPGVLLAGDQLWRSEDLRREDASGARWLCPQRARRSSLLPVFYAVQVDSYSPAAANSIIANDDCRCLTCRNAAARLILRAQKDG